jgi:hypothetical protein
MYFLHIYNSAVSFWGFATVADLVHKHFVPAAGGEVGRIRLGWV